MASRSLQKKFTANYQLKPHDLQHGYLCRMLENETHRLRAVEPTDAVFYTAWKTNPMSGGSVPTSHPSAAQLWTTTLRENMIFGAIFNCG